MAICLNVINFAVLIYQPFNCTIMKKDFENQDFWEYVARIQEEVGQEVLEQVTDEEYFPCVRTITDYMYNLRNLHIGRIWAMNITDNKFIQLINEALKKRNVFISFKYIHISINEHQDYGKED